MCSIHMQGECQILGPCCDYGCATVRPMAQFDVEEDTKNVYVSVHAGKDEQTLINILTNRVWEQRKQIKLNYKLKYNRDLQADIKSAFGGDKEKILVALVEDPMVLDARALRHAVKGIGTDEDLLNEIIATRNFQQLQEIKLAYQQEFKRDLVKDVKDDTSGGYLTVLMHCLNGERSEISAEQSVYVHHNGPHAIVDADSVKSQVTGLKSKNGKKSSQDDNIYIYMVTYNNAHQLRAIVEEYEKTTQTDIYTAISKDLSGDLAKCIRAFVMATLDRPRYFAERLHAAMKGAGTDESTLIRILMRQSEIDLLDIKRKFMKLYNKQLDFVVASETSGGFKKILLSLLDEK